MTPHQGDSIIVEMIDTPLTLMEQQVTTSRYKQYTPLKLPKIIMGFVINNMYDEKRLRIKPIANPKNIKHYVGSEDGLKPMYFHGIELNSRRKVSHLCSVIKQAMPVTQESYRNILKYNRLSCDQCGQYLRDGVYPIDMSCLPVLSTNKYKNDFLYLRSLLEENKDLPWFSSWSEFNIFMLCTSFLQQ